ncbi:hypothetical protein PoB_006728300 [Plakobranchus ocellatus]|uniref:Uncharacterized protein n=1 Tax=Plakobranchus ocellatus TaxID=259542 RepID=A0AAV4D9P5_9GAST|nr:hypothetical protein PoB_006728300 [Plakobranchus ocellatus]
MKVSCVRDGSIHVTWTSKYHVGCLPLKAFKSGKTSDGNLESLNFTKGAQEMLKIIVFFLRLLAARFWHYNRHCHDRQRDGFKITFKQENV